MSEKQQNSFLFTGTLERVESFTTNAGKKILTLVFKTGGQWPQWIACKCFGRLCEQSGDWNPGAVIRVDGRLGGREYNGKVYPENVAESVEVVSQAELPTGAPPEDGPEDDSSSVPF